MYDEWNGNNYVTIETDELAIIEAEIASIDANINDMDSSALSDSIKDETLVILDIWKRFIRKNYYRIYSKDSDRCTVYVPIFKQYYYKLLTTYSDLDLLRSNPKLRPILISIFTIGKILDMGMDKK
jgi:hypothetical protein